MNKELIDHVWKHCLPKEFKEEVKDDYKELVSALDYFQNKISLNNEECDRCDLIREKRAIYNKYFGHHNLTSDAEGEEMLTVSRKQVQRRYHMAYECKHSGLLSHDDVQFWKGWQGALDDLFGPKCLPDDACNVASNGASNVASSEPKPAEPKLRRGSFAYHDNVKVRITKIKANGDVIAYTKDGYRLIGRECDFEPYTESAEEASPNVNSSDIDIDELVAKGCVPDPAKQFDNILKDSFSKERRLTIAAQMMQGLICAPLIPGVDPNLPAEYLAQMAFRLADALIAEWRKD